MGASGFVGRYNSRLLKAYASLDARVAKLGRLVKFWAKQRQVNEALEGILGGVGNGTGRLDVVLGGAPDGALVRGNSVGSWLQGR